MGWTGDEIKPTKKGMETSSKILLGAIACIVFIIILIMVLLLNIKANTFKVMVDRNHKGKL